MTQSELEKVYFDCKCKIFLYLVGREAEDYNPEDLWLYKQTLKKCRKDYMETGSLHEFYNWQCLEKCVSMIQNDNTWIGKRFLKA